MRLSVAEIDGIKAALADHFGAPCPVRLFGSRVDDTRRGGDIDIAVDVPAGRAGFMEEVRLGIAIAERIGERKVDILLLENGIAATPDRRDRAARRGAAVSEVHRYPTVLRRLAHCDPRAKTQAAHLSARCTTNSRPSPLMQGA